MEKIAIDGGISLKGEVSIRGAKNAALPIMAASILSSGENIISNTPRLRDITTMGNLLTRLGINFQAEDNRIFLRTHRINSIEAKVKKLKGASVYFDIPTVTGTENLMMAAVLADGETVIENAACEPEVVDLANALISMGADIQGAGTNIIKIKE